MSGQVHELFNLGAAELAAIVRIDAALERMARGTYGACVTCQAAIELERLEAFPESEHCGLCATKS